MKNIEKKAEALTVLLSMRVEFERVKFYFDEAKKTDIPSDMKENFINALAEMKTTINDLERHIKEK